MFKIILAPLRSETLKRPTLKRDGQGLNIEGHTLWLPKDGSAAQWPDDCPYLVGVEYGSKYGVEGWEITVLWPHEAEAPYDQRHPGVIKVGTDGAICPPVP